MESDAGTQLGLPGDRLICLSGATLGCEKTRCCRHGACCVAARVLAGKISDTRCQLPSAVVSLGQATPITVHVRDPRGIRRLQAFVEQNGARYPVFATAQPSSSLTAPGTSRPASKTTPQLQAGNAKLIIEATSNDLLRKTGARGTRRDRGDAAAIVSVDSEQHYLYLGMADLATFNVSGELDRSGSARRRPEISRVAHAGRQAGPVFAVCLRLEYAARHGAGGLRFEWLQATT